MEARVAERRIGDVAAHHDRARLAGFRRTVHVERRRVRRIGLAETGVGGRRPLRPRRRPHARDRQDPQPARKRRHVDAPLANRAGTDRTRRPRLPLLRHAEAVHDRRSRRILHVHDEEPVVRIAAEGEAAGDARRPEILVPGREDGEVDARDPFRLRGVGEREDVEAASRAVPVLHRLRAVVLRVMPRRAVKDVAVNLQTVAEAAEPEMADRTERLQVARVEDLHGPAAPFAGVEVAVAVAVRLRLARLADADVRRVVGVGDVHHLHAVDALGEERRLPDDVDARRELDRIVARTEPHVLRVARVDDPHPRLARDDIDEAVLGDDLAVVVHAGQLSEELRLQRFAHVKRRQHATGDDVEHRPVEAHAHRPLRHAGHAHRPGGQPPTAPERYIHRFRNTQQDSQQGRKKNRCLFHNPYSLQTCLRRSSGI